MASSRGCAPAWASSLWLHAASRRRPSLRQAPGAMADQPRPRGHPRFCPLPPHARARGLKLRFSRGRAPAMRPHRTCPAGQTACRSGVRRSAPWPGEHPSPRVLQPVCGVRVCPRGPRRVSGRTSELRVSHLTWEGRLPRPLVPAALSRGRTGCRLRPLPLVRGPCPGRAHQEAHALPGAPGTPSLPLGTSGVCASSLALRRVQAQASRPLPKARISASPTPAQHGVPAHSHPGLG